MYSCFYVFIILCFFEHYMFDQREKNYVRSYEFAPCTMKSIVANKRDWLGSKGSDCHMKKNIQWCSKNVLGKSVNE